MDTPTNKLEIFTDGACSGNPGPGGWGVILCWPDKQKEMYGGEKDTTNNRMELLAVIKGLETLSQNSEVVVYTDSQYVQKGMTEWLEKWKLEEFRVKGGLRVNHDLWRQLDSLAAKHNVSWKWIRGHSGHDKNDRADALARRGVREMIV
tara:strand:- start:952 stop:1398 length:447 start_codon:yes stop_codon:yes gene_type:complete